jgi:DNA-directed RNA polymerase subunit RPC12/RpoP
MHLIRAARPPEEAPMEGYCVKCRAKVQMTGAKEVTMKNGKKAMDGKCAKCGTRVFKILPKK